MSHLVNVNILLRSILNDDSKTLTSLLKLGDIDPFSNRVSLDVEPSDEDGNTCKSIFDFALKKGKHKCVFAMLTSHGYNARSHTFALNEVLSTVSEDILTLLCEDASIKGCSHIVGQPLLFFPGRVLQRLLSMDPSSLLPLAPQALQTHEETELPPLLHYLMQTHPSFIDLSIIDRLVALQEHACSSWLTDRSAVSVIDTLRYRVDMNGAAETSKYADALNTYPELGCGACLVEQHLCTLEDALQYTCSRSMWPAALRLAQAHLLAQPLCKLAMGVADCGCRNKDGSVGSKDTSRTLKHTCNHRHSHVPSHPRPGVHSQQLARPQFDPTAALRSLVLLGPTPAGVVSRYAHLMEHAAWDAARAKGTEIVAARAMEEETMVMEEVETETEVSFEIKTMRGWTQAREGVEAAATVNKDVDRDRKCGATLPARRGHTHQHSDTRRDRADYADVDARGDEGVCSQCEGSASRGSSSASPRRARCGGLGCWGEEGPLLPSAIVCVQSLLWWSNRLPQPQTPQQPSSLHSSSSSLLFPSPRCALAAALIAMGADAGSPAGPTHTSATRMSMRNASDGEAARRASSASTTTNGPVHHATSTLAEQGCACTAAGGGTGAGDCGDSLIMRAASQRDWEVLCGAASALQVPTRVEVCTCASCPRASRKTPLSPNVGASHADDQRRGIANDKGVHKDKDVNVHQDVDADEDSGASEQLCTSVCAGSDAVTALTSDSDLGKHVSGLEKSVGVDCAPARVGVTPATTACSHLCGSITAMAASMDMDADMEWVCLDSFPEIPRFSPHSLAHNSILPLSHALWRTPPLMWPVRACTWQWAEELTACGASVADTWATARNRAGLNSMPHSPRACGRHAGATGGWGREWRTAEEQMSGGAGVLFDAACNGNDAQECGQAGCAVRENCGEAATGHIFGPVGGECGAAGGQCARMRGGTCPVGERVFSPWTCGAAAAAHSCTNSGDWTGNLEPMGHATPDAAVESAPGGRTHSFVRRLQVVDCAPRDVATSRLHELLSDVAGLAPTVPALPSVKAGTQEDVEARLSHGPGDHVELEVVVRGSVVFPDGQLPRRECSCCSWPWEDSRDTATYEPLPVTAGKRPRVVLTRDVEHVARESDGSYPAESKGVAEGHDCLLTPNTNSYIGICHETEQRGRAASRWLRYTDADGLPLLGDVDCAAVRAWECSLLYNNPNAACPSPSPPTGENTPSRCLQPRHVTQLLAAISSPLNAESIVQLARSGHWSQVCALLQGGGLGEAQLRILLGLQREEFGAAGVVAPPGAATRTEQHWPLPSLFWMLVHGGAVALWLQLMRAVVKVAEAQATIDSSPRSVSDPHSAPLALLPFIAAPPLHPWLPPALLADIAAYVVAHPYPALFRLQDALMDDRALTWTMLPYPKMQNPECYFPEVYDRYFLETRASSRIGESGDTSSVSTNGGLAVLHSGLVAAVAIITAQCTRCGPRHTPQGDLMPSESPHKVLCTGVCATQTGSPALAEATHPANSSAEAYVPSVDTDHPISQVHQTLPPLPAALLPSVVLCTDCALTLTAFTSPLLLSAAAAHSPRAIQLLRGFGADVLYACTDDDFPSLPSSRVNAQASVELSALQRLLLQPPRMRSRVGRTALAELFHVYDSAQTAKSVLLHALIAPVEVANSGSEPVPTVAKASHTGACHDPLVRVPVHPPLALPAPRSIEEFVDIADVLVHVASSPFSRIALELLLMHGLRVDTPLFRAHASTFPSMALREVFGISASPDPPLMRMRLYPVQPPLLPATVWTMPMLCVRAGQEWLLRALLEQHATTGEPIRQSEPRRRQRSFYVMEDTEKTPKDMVSDTNSCK